MSEERANTRIRMGIEEAGVSEERANPRIRMGIEEAGMSEERANPDLHPSQRRRV